MRTKIGRGQGHVAVMPVRYASPQTGRVSFPLQANSPCADIGRANNFGRLCHHESPSPIQLRTAIIDLGTNTFNLLIADVDAVRKTFTVSYSTKQAVKLGEGGLTDNLIRPQPMQRAKDALTAYMEQVRDSNCDRVLAFGTSAMRDAANAGELVQWAAAHLMLDVEVISGEEEARLITEGVRLAVPMDERPVLIMDIGGGSTEFIIANENDILWQRSYQLGISRLRQLLRPSDPVSLDDVTALEGVLTENLGEMTAQCRLHGVQTLIGSSGSFDSFMEMVWASKGIVREVNDVLNAPFDLSELADLNSTLLSLGFEQRKRVPGLVEMRVDTIHLASHMVQWVLRECGLNEAVLSTYALKEGVLHRVMEGR